MLLKTRFPSFAQLLIFSCGLLIPELVAAESLIKTSSVFYPRTIIEHALQNTAIYDWARTEQKAAIERAKPWLESSDEELWNMMFGPNITRSWMVWSDGYCPVSKKPVRMYDWEVDAWRYPWKVRSPHTGDLFPTNDFKAYYDSGLDAHGVFQPDRADRSLLFNSAHPDPNDPLHKFGVDDGEGYVEGDKRWRFIGYYLKAGQWKQMVLAGIEALSQAYLATGERIYAHKAAILLDRVADLYPTFVFKTQGEVYEYRGHRGFVSTWHDACEEVHDMALAYDRIFEAIQDDGELVTFLSHQSNKYKLDNPKDSSAKIQENIENRIFRETIRREDDIRSNYPRTPIAMTVMKAVMEWPSNREEVLGLVSEILKTSIVSDGLTGEEGMYGYTRIFPNSFVPFLMRLDRLDSNLVGDLYQRFPDLYRTYRFHLDVWCLNRFYPRVGDTGKIAEPVETYEGVSGNTTENQHFLWRMYELTGDPDFIKVLVLNNGGKIEGLGQSIFFSDSPAFQDRVKQTIDQYGLEIAQTSVNKEQWGLSILRSGEGTNRRAVWLDHDSDTRHSHRDALNLGLFAKGTDIMPDYGYPPVGYGGWGAPKAKWYTQSAAHNTVVVDCTDSKTGYGATTLWGCGERFQITRVDAPAVNNGNRFNRTIASIDINDDDCYVFDLFYTVGGKDHTKFQGASFGEITTHGLSLTSADDWGFDTEMANFRTDPSPRHGWSADWKFDDPYANRQPGEEVHLRYTDLTKDTQVTVNDSWVAAGLFSGDERWVQRVLVRRTSNEAPLTSCFVGILEPYQHQPLIRSITRYDVQATVENGIQDGDGIVIVELTSGRKDSIGFRQPSEIVPAKPTFLIDEANGLQSDSEIFWISQNADLIRYVLCNGSYLRCGGTIIQLKAVQTFIEIEIAISEQTVSINKGDSDAIESIREAGKLIFPIR